MSYPDAYCVRCKTHTDTMGKHTVILSNKRRAMKGVCPVCASDTYRLLPEKDDESPKKNKKKIEKDREILSSEAPASLISAHLHGRKRKTVAPALKNEAQEIPVYTSRLDPLSRVELQRDVYAQKYWNYGLLMTIFGLSIACGFMICVVLFRA